MRQDTAGECSSVPEAGPRSGRASDLVSLVYLRLRRVAASLLRSETSHSLPPTGLVHEAYMRLAENNDIDWNGKTHFFRVAVRQMRRILVDRSRHRRARKRVPEAALFIPAEELQEVDKLALGQALRDLHTLSPRQAQIFNLHCLGGLTFPEAARVMSISERTAKNDWTVARSWLARYLYQSQSNPNRQGHAQREAPTSIQDLP